jgi:LacI family transcriptional regulator
MLAAHQQQGGKRRMPTKKAVRLQDVADAAEVSVMAVSHVLNGSGMGRVSVSPAKTLKIQKAADKLGYRRNIAASMLRGGSSDVVGVMIDPSYSGADELLGELRLAAAAREKLLLTTQPAVDQPFDAAAALDALLGRQVDAVLYLAGHITPNEGKALRASSTPVVSVALAGDGPDIAIDRAAGLHLVLTHLKEMRRRRIVALTPKDPPEAAAAYKQLARAARDEVSRSLSVNVHPYEAGHPVHAKPYLALADEVMRRYAPDTIIADSDEAAVSMLRALRQRGAKVPESISVIGWGNTNLATSFDPQLTSVGIDNGMLAKTVLDRLLSNSTGAPTLEPQLFVRETA